MININKNIKLILLSTICLMILNVWHVSAQDQTYFENFGDQEIHDWSEIYDGNWKIINGMASSTGGFTGLIFDRWHGTKYISDVDIMANKTQIRNFAQIGFIFYYNNSDNFARVFLLDDNRPKGDNDGVFIEKSDINITNTRVYINTSNDTIIDFDPNKMHHLKVVRLDRNIYIYYDNMLALTTEFRDENPDGKVGFVIYAATGYFANFSIRPIYMKNASDHIDKSILNSTNSVRIGSLYVLRLEGVTDDSAIFNLNKFNKTIYRVTVKKNDKASLYFENGDEAVTFKLAKIFRYDNIDNVELDDIISAKTDYLNMVIDDLDILPIYYQKEDMIVNFSIVNKGNVRYTGNPVMTIYSEGDTKTLYPDIDLSHMESKNFTTILKSAKSPGRHNLVVTLETDEYDVITKSLYYDVRILNPIITTLSADLREDTGIRGIVTLDSAYPDQYIGWDTKIDIEIFKILWNGKERVHFKEIPVKNKTFDIYIPYDKFYDEDWRYLISITAGEMKNERFFEIKGQDGIYNPSIETVPPTITSNFLYPQLILLIISMMIILLVRNHTYLKYRSLPIDRLIIISSVIIFVISIFKSQIDMVIKSMIIVGIGLLMSYRKSSLDKLFKDSPMTDFIGLVIIFMSASYIIFLFPEFNIILTIGILMLYYVTINIYGKK